MALRPLTFLLPLLPLLLLFAPFRIAHAEPPWHASVGGGTHVPIDIHARLDLEGPGGLLLSGAVGYLPRPYVDSLNDFAVSYGWYDERTSELVSAALKDALVWRAQLGWKPGADAGFYLLGGYQLVTLGGGLTGAEVLSLATGRAPPELDVSRVSIEAESTLHQFDAELGWRWRLVEGLHLGAGLGGFVTFSSSTTLREQGVGPLLSSRLQPYLRDWEGYLDDVYTSYIHSPRVSLTLTYRLF